MSTTRSTPRAGAARVAAGVLGSLAAACAMAFLVLVATFLAVFRCGDGCEDAAVAEHWRWTAQLVLALVGTAAGSAALVLAWTGRVRAACVLLAAAAVCLVGWVAWVLGSGSF